MPTFTEEYSCYPLVCSIATYRRTLVDVLGEYFLERWRPNKPPNSFGNILCIGVVICAHLRSTSSNGRICWLTLVFEQSTMPQVINPVHMIVTVANTFKGYLTLCGEYPPRVLRLA
jgi:hypothetical protein